MLLSMKEILVKASEGSYAVAAPNVFYEMDARACIAAAEEVSAPIVLDVLYDANPDIHEFAKILRYLAEKAKVPVAINLDHGTKLDYIKDAISADFTSVMVDRSAMSFDDNVREVSEVVKIAKAKNISVEAELGHVGSADNYEQDGNAKLTEPEEAKKYIELTGVDALAVAIGTAHGSYPRGFTPYIDIDRLVEIKKVTNNFPLVLHGSSGTKTDDLVKACKMGINKVNVSNDIFKAAIAKVKEGNLEGQNAYDLFNVISKAITEKVKSLIVLYGSVGKG